MNGSKNILKLGYLGGDPWPLPIFTALNEAETKGKVKKSKNFSQGKTGGGLYISTKLSCLRILCGRINKNAEEILKIVKDSKNIDTKYAFTEVDNEIIFSLILDLETYFKQLFSIIELIKKLFDKLFSFILDPLKKDAYNFLELSGHKDLRWYKLLEKNRHILTHATSLWVDVCIGEQAQLIIENKHFKTLQSASHYLTWSELSEIDSGFKVFLNNTQEEAIKYFKGL